MFNHQTEKTVNSIRMKLVSEGLDVKFQDAIKNNAEFKKSLEKLSDSVLDMIQNIAADLRDDDNFIKSIKAESRKIGDNNIDDVIFSAVKDYVITAIKKSL